jgi:chromosome segregation ATPase
MAALLVSAFLLGGVLAALLFVGVWRHTAAEGDRARSAQLQSRQQLRAARVQLARRERKLSTAQSSLQKLRRDRRRLTQELARLRGIDTGLARNVAPRLQSIAAETDTLGQKAAKLGTALATLRDYLRNASSTGVDSAFLAAQVGYLIGSAGSARATASQLAAEIRQAQATAAALSSKR